MPRNRRCVAAGVPFHITQRGVDRRETFSSDADRQTYLKLLFHLLPESGTRLLGWCLMPNHVHLIAIPNAEDSLAVLLRRLQGRYAQYYNAIAGRLGHLWENRYYSCMLGPGHLVRALRYVDLNPVRAGLTRSAQNYSWSSAAAHLRGADPLGLLDLDRWASLGLTSIWASELRDCADNIYHDAELRRCTHAGRPFGDRRFLDQMEARFDRSWLLGRPPTNARTATTAP